MAALRQRKRVLFLCTGNSCRSQMAEGLLRARASDRFEVFSAGTRPSAVNPLTVEAMAEIGIDIRQHRSKSVYRYVGLRFDYVITVCDAAAEVCPTFPGDAGHSTTRLHWPFEDPGLARGNIESLRATFARIRDQIAAKIDEWLAEA